MSSSGTAFVQSALYKANLEAGNFLAEQEKMRKSSDATTASIDKVTAATEKAGKNTSTSAQAFEKYSAGLDPIIRRHQQFQREQDRLNQFQSAGTLSTNQYAAATVALRSKYDDLDPATARARDNMGRFTKAVDIGKAALGAFGIALTADALVTGLINFGRNTFNTVSALQEQAIQLGIGVDAMEAYHAAFLAGGIAVAKGDAAIAKFVRTIGEAKESNGPARQAFIDLNVSAADLASPEGGLSKVASALLEIPDVAERARLETALFGKAGQQLETVLRDLAEPMDEQIRRARELGIAYDKDMAVKADAAADKMAYAWKRLEVSTADSFVAMSNSLAGFIENLNLATAKTSTWAETYRAAFNLWTAPIQGVFGDVFGTQPKPPPPKSDFSKGFGVLAPGAVDLMGGGPGTSGGFDPAGTTAAMARYRAEQEEALRLQRLSGRERAAETEVIKAAQALQKANNVESDKTVQTYAEAAKILGDTNTKLYRQLGLETAIAGESKQQRDRKVELIKYGDVLSDQAKELDRVLTQRAENAERDAAFTAKYIEDLKTENRLVSMLPELREEEEIVLRAIEGSHGTVTEEQIKQIRNLVRIRQETEKWNEEMARSAAVWSDLVDNFMDTGQLDLKGFAKDFGADFRAEIGDTLKGWLKDGMDFLGKGFGKFAGNVAGGASFGSTLGSNLGHMLGLGGGSGLGGMIGGGIGSIFGPVGSMVGSLAGALIGGAFRQSDKAYATFGADGQFSLSGKASSNPLAQEAAQALSGTLDVLRTAGVIFKDELKAIAIGKKDMSFYDIGGGLTRIDSKGDPAALAKAVVDAMLKNADFGGSASLKQVLTGNTFANTSDLAAAANFVTNVYDAIASARKPLTDVETAMKGLVDQFKQAKTQAQELGLAVSPLVSGAKLQFDQAIADQIKAITDPLSLALDLETRNAEARLNAAREFGANIEQVQRLNALMRQQVEDQARSQQTSGLRSLIDNIAFGGLSSQRPDQEYFSALTRYNQAKATALGNPNSANALNDFTSIAQSFLPLARNFLGTSQTYGRLEADVVSTARSLGGDAADPSGIGRALISAVSSGNTAQLIELQTQTQVLQSMRDEIARLTVQIDSMMRRVAA